MKSIPSNENPDAQADPRIAIAGAVDTARAAQLEIENHTREQVPDGVRARLRRGRALHHAFSLAPGSYGKTGRRGVHLSSVPREQRCLAVPKVP